MSDIFSPAVKLYKDGKPEEAISMFDKMIEENTAEDILAEAYYNRAFIKFAMNCDPTDIRNDLVKSVELVADVDPYIISSLLMIKDETLTEFDNAIEEIKLGLKINPNHDMGLFILAKYYVTYIKKYHEKVVEESIATSTVSKSMSLIIKFQVLYNKLNKSNPECYHVLKIGIEFYLEIYNYRGIIDNCNLILKKLPNDEFAIENLVKYWKYVKGTEEIGKDLQIKYLQIQKKEPVAKLRYINLADYLTNTIQ